MRPCRSGVCGAGEGVCANVAVAVAAAKQISDTVMSSDLRFIIFHFSFFIYCKPLSSFPCQMANRKGQMANGKCFTDQSILQALSLPSVVLRPRLMQVLRAVSLECK